MKKPNLILELIFRCGPITREKIISDLGIGKVTIGRKVAVLLKEKKILECGSVNGGRGRSAKLLKINPDFGYFLSFVMTAGRLIGGVANLDGKLIFKCDFPFSEKDEKSFVPGLIFCIEKLINSAKIDKKKIAGIGISLFGSFDEKNGMILGLQGRKEWKPISPGNLIKEKFGKDVFLFDTTNALARAEYEIRKEEGIDNLLYVYSGEGIGLGIILNRKIYSGSKGNAGEIGHLVVNENGARCYCGNYGCLETFAGTGFIINQVKKGIEEGVHSEVERIVEGVLDKITIKEIALAILRNDKLAVNAVEEAGKHLGGVLAFLVNIFDPELIVLGGELMLTGEIILSTIQKEIRRKALPVMLKNLRVEFSKLTLEQALSGTVLSMRDQLREKESAKDFLSHRRSQ